MYDFMKDPEVKEQLDELNLLIAKPRLRKLTKKQLIQIADAVKYLESTTENVYFNSNYFKNKIKNLPKDILSVLIKLYYCRVMPIVNMKFDELLMMLNKMPSLQNLETANERIMLIPVEYEIQKGEYEIDENWISEKIEKIQNMISVNKEKAFNQFVVNGLKLVQFENRKLFEEAGLHDGIKFNKCASFIRERYIRNEFKILEDVNAGKNEKNNDCFLFEELIREFNKFNNMPKEINWH